MSAVHDGSTKCPFCFENVQSQARKCRHCHEWLKEEWLKEGHLAALSPKAKRLAQRALVQSLQDQAWDQLRKRLWAYGILLTLLLGGGGAASIKLFLADARIEFEAMKAGHQSLFDYVRETAKETAKSTADAEANKVIAELNQKLASNVKEARNMGTVYEPRFRLLEKQLNDIFLRLKESQGNDDSEASPTPVDQPPP